MLRISGYFFDGIEVGRLLHERVAFLPSKLVYQISSGSLSLISGEKLAVDVGQAGELPAGVRHEQVADVGRSRDDEREPSAVRRRGVRGDLLVAGRERLDLARGGVDALDVRAAVLRGTDQDESAVLRPERLARAAARAARADRRSTRRRCRSRSSR
jgi:hypothetical protein